MRRLPLLACLLLAALIVVPTAGARVAPDRAGPAWAASWKPVNADVLAVGTVIQSAIKKAEGKTDAQLARQFDAVAAQTGRVADRVSDYTRLPRSLRAQKAKLVDALLAAQLDLKKVANAARGHNGTAAGAAVKHLIQVVSPKVRDARRAIAAAAGIS
jgi:hypothetical protein